jgi:hypothetical protein
MSTTISIEEEFRDYIDNMSLYDLACQFPDAFEGNKLFDMIEDSKYYDAVFAEWKSDREATIQKAIDAQNERTDPDGEGADNGI